MDQAVERREQDRAVGHRLVGDLGVGVPLAVPCPPDAERALLPAFELALGLAPRERLALREDALGEVPDALLAVAPCHRDLAARREDVEHQPHVPVAPPAVAHTRRHHVVLEVAGEQRPAGLELSQDVPPEARVLAQEVTDPLVALQLAAAPELRHARTLERQVLDRVDEGVVLEELPLLPEQAVELGRVERAEPAEENELLGRRDRRDRVHLQKAEPAHGVEHGARRAVEKLRPDGDPASLLLPHDPRQRSSLDVLEVEVADDAAHDVVVDTPPLGAARRRRAAPRRAARAAGAGSRRAALDRAVAVGVETRAEAVAGGTGTRPRMPLGGVLPDPLLVDQLLQPRRSRPRAAWMRAFASSFSASPPSSRSSAWISAGQRQALEDERREDDAEREEDDQVAVGERVAGVGRQRQRERGGERDRAAHARTSRGRPSRATRA